MHAADSVKSTARSQELEDEHRPPRTVRTWRFLDAAHDMPLTGWSLAIWLAAAILAAWAAFALLGWACWVLL